MGTLADSLFNVLMGWVRALVSSIWALFDTEHTTVLEFLGKNWLTIAVIIIAVGLVMDWLVWLIRWRPYHRAARRMRHMLHLDDEEEEAPGKARAHAAVRREPEPVMQQETGRVPVPEMNKMPEMRTDNIPDAHAYPGMRYGTQPASDAGETQRYAAVHSEGPGAAEVERRRAEIDAWRMQMEEEQQAAARQAAYEAEQKRKAQAAYEAEQKRKTQTAYAAEQKNIAQPPRAAEQRRKPQTAYAAEQKNTSQLPRTSEQRRRPQAVQAAAPSGTQPPYSRQSTYSAQQAEYARQMAEYEKKKAQYEREMAEYQRKKAAYDAEMRRRQEPVYSDYVMGETVDTLPDPPKWPKIQAEEKAAKQKNRLKERVSQMIEPENEEISPIASLPPRIDPKDAFHTAKMPAIKLPRRKR